MSSGSHPMFDATTGIPHAIDSMADIDVASTTPAELMLGMTTMSAEQ